MIYIEVNTIELPETGEGKKWEWLAFLRGKNEEELAEASPANR